MNLNKLIAAASVLLLSSAFTPVGAEETVDYKPSIHGTVRSKFEYQNEEGESRFEVRNARVSVDGKVAKEVSYKAEIDLSDEGSIKMLDAYGRFTPIDNLNFTLGQMRVPFTIDAHRSPHQQLFANRSFIAKQVGNVRDVGFTAGYTFPGAVPVVLDAGIFNGSGLTNQKNFWTKQINFSAKCQVKLPCGFTAVLSTQKIKPSDVTVMMYDAGLTFKLDRWHLEAEYLRKHYADNAFDNVNAFNSMASYTIPVGRRLLHNVSVLGRYDYMDDHSDGKTVDDQGALKITDGQRSRITGGVTLGVARKPFVADVRINYEKYFYDDISLAKTSEHDKFVVELMVRF